MKRAETLLKPQPGVLVIAGVTGDLSQRYFLPALYDLLAADVLPDPFRIVGLSRRKTTVKELLESVRQSVKRKGQKIDEKLLSRLESMLEICFMDISKPDDYKILKDRLEELEDAVGTCLHRIFYLAIPSQIFGPVLDGLGTFGLNLGCQHGSTESRLLIEKPFGHDLASARELITRIRKVFGEKYIYRVDHYLAKENAQNILTLRFKNPLFTRIWDRESIDHILITASETIGVGRRGNFYEQTGALKDFVQSHLLQLLALVTMEEPVDRSPKALHAQKLSLLQAINPIRPDQVAAKAVRGQYEGYGEEVGNPGSHIETYAALELEINNARWKGVPVLLRTGKALTDRITEITFMLRESRGMNQAPNALTIRIQPNEGIVLSLVTKKPGFNKETENAQMEFCYNQSFEQIILPNAYEYVLVDALRGDQTLFATADEVIRSWEILDNIVQSWSHDSLPPESYKRGSWGPASADKLAENADATWLTHILNICPVIPKRESSG